MNSIRFVNNELEEKKLVETEPENVPRPKTYNWRISYSLVESGQEKIIFQRRSTVLLRVGISYKGKSRGACPADLNTLKRCTREARGNADLKREDDELETSDSNFVEYETEAGAGKLKTWDEYRKLAELARSMPRAETRARSLTQVTSLQRIRVRKGYQKSRPCLSAQAKRSIIKAEIQRTVLVVDSSYVEFRNFKTNRLYKRTVTLQNVATSPARFQIGGRPYRSRFTVIIKSTKGDRGIVPPGMELQLIVLFRCDAIDEPEEMLIINVEHGRPLYVRLHGHKDPPILLGIDASLPESSRTLPNSPIEARKTELASPRDSNDSSAETSSGSGDSSSKFASITFDCKRGFVGETVLVSVRFKNVGGEGRFFIMSEIDWSSMYIEDVTDSNVLQLSCFAIQPTYFSMRKGEEVTLHMRFMPRCYGIHVDKLYILCDNCTVLPTEIIGDGIIYESSFIQISKQLEKVWPLKWDIDKRAHYYIKLKANTLDGNAKRTVCASNNSEISMHFRWKKRHVASNESEINEQNHFPLELLRIHPDHGIFTPTTVHSFIVSAECHDFQPGNHYFAVLQLYVEDIPLAAISKELELCTEESTARRRNTLNSVDVWVADVEVWVQCVVEDESKTTSGEMSESAEESVSCREYSPRDHAEEIDTVDVANCDECKPTSRLVADELFAHYDFVSLKQFEPLLHEKIISMGIVRPTRTLFVGVEETYVLGVRNLSNNSLNYTWGEARGLDATKMKFCVCPDKGEVAVGKTEEMIITLTPMKEGIVQFLQVPCFVGDSRKTILLGIECFIEPLYVTFHLPLNEEDTFDLRNNFTRVEWRADSLQVAFDSAGRSRRNMKLLNKYKMREEQELMNTNLDQGAVLKDASAGPSVSDVGEEESREHSALSAHASEIIRMSNSKENGDEARRSVVPFFETVLPPLTQPVVIEFLNLSLRLVKKKTFVVKNETPIPSRLALRVKNYYPVACSCDSKSKEDRIKFLYRQVFGRNKDLIEETLCRVKQPQSGVVIYVDPLRSDIGPFEALPVDVYVFADTWGIYVDELEINITGLPLYTLAICVQVIGSPISLPICEGTLSGVPAVKYGMVPLGTRLEPRKLSLKNTSVVPVAIDWHVFLIKPAAKTMPFNVIMDVCTPFTDELASELRAGKQKTDSETHLEEHIANRVDSKIYNRFDIYDSGSYVDASNASDIIASTYSATSFVTQSWTSIRENLRDIKTSLDWAGTNSVRSLKNHDYLTDGKGVCSKASDSSKIQEKDENEIKVLIIPYYGVIDTTTCTVTPKETFVSPKSETSMTVDLQFNKADKNKIGENFEGQFVCKILGFLRIAPSDKYRDNCYSRLDGYYYPPIEIEVTANVIKPQLVFDIPESDRTFICCANDVMQHRKKALRLRKTFFLNNHERDVINIVLETYDPFHVKSISVSTDINPCKPIEIICINAHGCAEVEIKCIVDAELIQTVLHTYKSGELHGSVITLKEPLIIIHSDKSTQEVELILQICLPLLKLSSYILDFGLVYVGDTKKLILIIENVSICSQSFRVNRKFKNSDFLLDYEKGELLGHYTRGSCGFVITVSFQPKKPGQSIETLEIITDIPYNIEECELHGEGVLDQKYHTPGV